jgi:hypothetical protein
MVTSWERWATLVAVFLAFMLGAPPALMADSQFSGWSAVPGGGTTTLPDAATVYKDRLYLFGIGTGDHAHYVSVFDGARWSGWSAVPGGGTTTLPDAATVYKDRLYLFGIGTGDHAHYVNVFDGARWSGWSAVPGEGTTTLPDAATVYKDRLYLFGIGTGDHAHYVNVFDGARWSGWDAVAGRGTTNVADAATPYNGKLYLFGIGIDDQKHYVNVAESGPSGTLTIASWTFSPDGCTLLWQGNNTTATQRQCYTDWQYRSASALSECPGQDRSGLLCYDSCKEGYDGVGPICWKRCPPGYADDGATCRKNAHIIGANNDACPWYDKCGLTFSRGCSKCPEGYHNDGCTCRIDVDIFAKDSYGRGVGSPMSCPSGTQQIAALCYGSCPAGYKADSIYCNATQQTCMEVPVRQPPDASALKPYCFTLRFPDSWARPCIGVATQADSDEHAMQIAQCNCQGQKCTIDKTDCSVVNSGKSCM